MGGEIQKAIVEGKHSFKLRGGSADRFEGEHFHQGKPVTKELLAGCLSKGDVDLVLDFTTADGNELLRSALEHGKTRDKAVLIGTTGLSPERKGAWAELTKSQKLRTLIAPNTSVGVLMLARIALSAAGVLAPLGFDIEIIETHHRRKADSPSGTAKFLAETLVSGLKKLRIVTNRSGRRSDGEIGMHSVRGGGVFGEHEIRLISESDEISLKHRAFSRALFASGALVLGDWLVAQKPGFYGLQDVEPEELSALLKPDRP